MVAHAVQQLWERHELRLADAVERKLEHISAAML
jgi:hypothetical protein